MNRKEEFYLKDYKMVSLSFFSNFPNNLFVRVNHSGRFVESISVMIIPSCFLLQQ